VAATGCTLITGASQGIGRAFADVFAEHGHPLVLVSLPGTGIDAVAAELRQRYGVDVVSFSLDLTRPTSAEALWAAVRDAGREVEILVNNAGVCASTPFLETPCDVHDAMLDLNIKAVVDLTHAFGRAMRTRRRGHILNLCSIAAFQPVPGMAVYAGTKAFILRWSEALAIELRADGVSVTTLCPGFTRTSMTAAVAGADFSLPGVPLLEPRRVAEEGYRAVTRRRPLHVVGAANRVLTSIISVMPEWARRGCGRIIAHAGWW